MKTKNIFTVLLATTLTSGFFAQGITLQSEIKNPTCFGDLDGSITVTPSGGVGGYKYFWSVSGTESYIEGLAAGTYDLTVLDDAGNTATQSYTLTQPEKVLIQGTLKKVTNFGGHDGEITLNVTGLTPTYNVDWSSTHGTGITQGQLNQTGLSAGVYLVTVTTEGGCLASKSFILTQKTPRLVNQGLLNNMNSSGHIGRSALVYPNPSNGPVNFSNVEATDTIEIYNQYGILVQHVNALEGTQLPTGNYNVMITHADGSHEVETLVVR